MSELRELYQELIIDHGRHPRNFGELDGCTHEKCGFNPLCGDKLKLFLRVNDNCIEQVQFTGEGCAISMASASLMTELLRGKTLQQADTIFSHFHQMVTNNDNQSVADDLGKLVVLAGVAEYPARVKCATLAWHTLMAALHNQQGEVTSE